MIEDLVDSIGVQTNSSSLTAKRFHRERFAVNPILRPIF
jgi:hypothetical protein